jgi:hypothetical protein
MPYLNMLVACSLPRKRVFDVGGIYDRQIGTETGVPNSNPVFFSPLYVGDSISKLQIQVAT